MRKILFLLKVEDLSEEQKEYLESYFDEQIFPVLTPMAVDAYRPFPILLNRSYNLAVSIELNADLRERHLAIVQVPYPIREVCWRSGGRWLTLLCIIGRCYLLLFGKAF